MYYYYLSKALWIPSTFAMLLIWENELNAWKKMHARDKTKHYFLKSFRNKKNLIFNILQLLTREVLPE